MKTDINIKRYIYNTEGDRNVIGDLFTGGAYFCYTLEDEIRGEGVKEYGVTAIPAGIYGWEVTYSPKFKRDMILIKSVPMFSGIRIHGGNTSKDSHGCPLVAFKTDGKRIWSTAEKKLTAWAKSVGGKGQIKIENVPSSYKERRFNVN